MKYAQIVHGIFVSRPNRFIAQIRIGETVHTVHVKNTGRCRELLVPGAEVLLEYHPDARELGRKTQYSLIGVYKAGENGLPARLVNMDSQAPNQVAKEWLEQGGVDLYPQNIRREVTYGQSRFDLAFETGGKPAFMEVKGVTLEKQGIAMFPDAPTERGVKHLQELADAAAHGFQAYVLFVVQMKGVYEFRPNWKTHETFARTLKEVSEKGVHVLAYDCLVEEDGFRIDKPIPVSCEREESSV